MEVGLRPEERRIFIVVKAQLYNPTSMRPGGIFNTQNKSSARLLCGVSVLNVDTVRRHSCVPTMPG